MKNEDKLEFAIIGMQEDSYKFNYNVDFSNLNKDKLEFQLEHHITVSAEPQSIIILMRVHLMNGAEELVLQGVRAIFKVKPFNNFVKEIQEGELKVSNPALIETFVSVCIGAIRGMLAKNLKGTALDDIVLPLIPMNVIKNNSTKQKK